MNRLTIGKANKCTYVGPNNMVSTPTRKSPPPKKAKISPKSHRPNVRPVSREDVVWAKLPDDFVLPDDPVDNINQPAIAGALTEALSLAGYLSESAITTTNYGICVNYNDKTVVKAPDWCWVPSVSVPKEEVERSYTPVLEGDLPLVVMEFLSETEGTEYSIKPSYPYGKLFFYEQILQVENYIIFSLRTGEIEYYRLSEEGSYEPQTADENGRHWLPEAQLFLGVWEGTRQDRTGLWLRWWDESGQMLLWGAERIEQEKARAEQEKARADETQGNAIAALHKLGLPAEQIADSLNLPVATVQQQLEQMGD